MYPDDRRYARTHEWVLSSEPPAEGLATIGITQFAQEELGDLVYADLPETGRALNAGESFGSLESVKTVSDVYAPVSGAVVEVNSALADHPELINSDPYGAGWLIKLRLSNPAELDSLLEAQAYIKSIR